MTFRSQRRFLNLLALLLSGSCGMLFAESKTNSTPTDMAPVAATVLLNM